MTPADALRTLLDQVDYTIGACGPTEMVDAVLPREVIALCRKAPASPPPNSGRIEFIHGSGPFREGEAAWHEGQEKATNPHSAHDEPRQRHEWNDGYDYGQQDQPRED